jgi:hypothetical protein
LKEYISKKVSAIQPKLNPKQIQLLENVFVFIKDLGAEPGFFKSSLINEQTHFYILVTYLINKIRNVEPKNVGNFLSQSEAKKIIKAASIFSGNTKPPDQKIKKKLVEYFELSEKQTTDVTKREHRETLFADILNLI